MEMLFPSKKNVVWSVCEHSELLKFVMFVKIFLGSAKALAGNRTLELGSDVLPLALSSASHQVSLFFFTYIILVFILNQVLYLTVI